MKLLPVIVVEGANDDSTPLMRIVQFCRVCELKVSERTIDVSIIPRGRDFESTVDRLTTASAEADIEAWEQHLREKHS